MVNRVLADLAVKISADTAQFTRELSKLDKSVRNFERTFKNVAATIGIAFGLNEIKNFTLEASKLAGEAQGVRAAFERLPNSVKILQQMKEATGGTASELKLLKAAVQANNFQIPIENLARLFQFATLRAQQTGQSVDFLVESIILGIGRKSPLILDNLGISAIRLREKLKGVSAEAATVGDVAKVVGDIAEEELSNMAGFSENASTKFQRLGAEAENLKIAIGTAFNQSGDGPIPLFIDLITKATAKVRELITILSFEEIAAAGLKNFQNQFNKIAEGLASSNESIRNNAKALANQFAFDVVQAINEVNLELDAAKKRLEELNKDNTFLRTPAQVKAANKEVINLNNQIQVLQGELNVLNKFKGDTFNLFKKEVKDAADEVERLNELSRAGRDTRKPITEVTTARNPFPTTVGVQNPIASGIDVVNQKLLESQNSIQAWAEVATIQSEIFRQEFERNAQSAQQFGSAAGDALAGVLSGQATVAQGLARITDEVVQQYGRQAIAAIIAKAAQSGGPFPFAAVAAATAATAAISGLLRNAAGFRGGRGGAGRSGFSQPSNFAFGGGVSLGQLVPDIQIKGQDLYVVLRNYEKNNKGLRANG
jgi:hypothetical protein